ncbi:hypothetical protein DLAC_02751 [Tieghemostelium lacteum]|uniref:Uncharacterized protein n=1 Tax=Tieghemostelium lacteum TaxID=361077 RepID=A0A152A3T6_TIELA|nr:hypothetical protein DLAC_02751 [Tieghemostelium lacteum]|eukprot:KYR00711.1 hypothetical protein DLAC_02751 [Tieghemostelium lacteum]
MSILGGLAAYDSDSDEDNIQEEKPSLDTQSSLIVNANKRKLEETLDSNDQDEDEDEEDRILKKYAVDLKPTITSTITNTSSSTSPINSLFSMLPAPKSNNQTTEKKEPVQTTSDIKLQQKVTVKENTDIRAEVQKKVDPSVNVEKFEKIINNSMVPGGLRKNLMKKLDTKKKPLSEKKEIVTPIQPKEKVEEEVEESYDIQPPTQMKNEEEEEESYDIQLPTEDEDNDEEEEINIQAQVSEHENIYRENQSLQRYLHKTSGNIVQVNQSQLMENNPERLQQLRQVQSSNKTQARVSSTLRHKHQLTAMLADYKQNKGDIEQKKIDMANRRAQNQFTKY